MSNSPRGRRADRSHVNPEYRDRMFTVMPKGFLRMQNMEANREEAHRPASWEDPEPQLSLSSVYTKEEIRDAMGRYCDWNSGDCLNCRIYGEGCNEGPRKDAGPFGMVYVPDSAPGDLTGHALQTLMDMGYLRHR